jgi:hypothetical protein
VTLTVHVPPEAIVFPAQLSVSVKSPEAATVIALRLDEPEFVSVTACWELVAPIAVFPKARLVGEVVVLNGKTVIGTPTEAALAYVAEIEAEPVPTAVTIPVGLTVATAVFEEV